MAHHFSRNIPPTYTADKPHPFAFPPVDKPHPFAFPPVDRSDSPKTKLISKTEKMSKMKSLIRMKIQRKRAAESDSPTLSIDRSNNEPILTIDEHHSQVAYRDYNTRRNLARTAKSAKMETAKRRREIETITTKQRNEIEAKQDKEATLIAVQKIAKLASIPIADQISNPKYLISNKSKTKPSNQRTESTSSKQKTESTSSISTKQITESTSSTSSKQRTESTSSISTKQRTESTSSTSTKQRTESTSSISSKKRTEFTPTTICKQITAPTSLLSLNKRPESTSSITSRQRPESTSSITSRQRIEPIPSITVKQRMEPIPSITVKKKMAPIVIKQRTVPTSSMTVKPKTEITSLLNSNKKTDQKYPINNNQNIVPKFLITTKQRAVPTSLVTTKQSATPKYFITSIKRTDPSSSMNSQKYADQASILSPKDRAHIESLISSRHSSEMEKRRMEAVKRRGTATMTPTVSAQRTRVTSFTDYSQRTAQFTKSLISSQKTTPVNRIMVHKSAPVSTDVSKRCDTNQAINDIKKEIAGGMSASKKEKFMNVMVFDVDSDTMKTIAIDMPDSNCTSNRSIIKTIRPVSSNPTPIPYLKILPSKAPPMSSKPKPILHSLLMEKKKLKSILSEKPAYRQLTPTYDNKGKSVTQPRRRTSNVASIVAKVTQAHPLEPSQQPRTSHHRPMISNPASTCHRPMKVSRTGPAVKLSNDGHYEVMNDFVMRRGDDDDDGIDADVLRSDSMFKELQSYLCVLCNKSKFHPTLGDLYGPIESYDEEFANREIWIHEDCATWAEGVYMTSDGDLIGLSEIMRYSSDKRCVFCDKGGASILCCGPKCNQKYHYKCAIDSNCKLNKDNFTILCPLHKKRSNLSNS